MLFYFITLTAKPRGGDINKIGFMDVFGNQLNPHLTSSSFLLSFVVPAWLRLFRFDVSLLDRFCCNGPFGWHTDNHFSSAHARQKRPFDVSLRNGSALMPNH